MPTTFSISGKVIALTGGASGIGLQTAILLASQGAIVSSADLSEAPLKEAEAKITASGGTVLTTVVDVRDDKAVDAWIATTVAKFGQLDGAVNLAGVISKGINVERVQDLNNEDWRFVLDVNLNGVMYCMRAQLKQTKDGGSVANAASICGVTGFPKNAAYKAGKHAVTGLPRAARKGWGRGALELIALRRK
jgi:NAD(P)-dependent dehydrogenase (short-subunit alcohol dehydrogenase family)